MTTRTVYIRRRPNNTKLPDELYYEATRKIGGSYARGSNDVLRGLNPEEEEKYLPEILGVGPKEPGWRKAKQDFWSDISVTVASGEGTKLDISLDSHDEPVNLNDWLIWKFIQKHVDVANSEEELSDNFQCKYFIYDPKKNQEVNVANMKQQKAATIEFLKISDNTAKMQQILRLLGYDTRLLSDDKPETAELELKKFVDKTPQRFLEVASDENLEMKSFLEECVSNNVIEKIGNVYLDGDQVLGNSLKEAVLWLNDKAHSKTLTVLKSRLEQAL
jgi:hypothetical protein